MTSPHDSICNAVIEPEDTLEEPSRFQPHTLVFPDYCKQNKFLFLLLALAFAFCSLDSVCQTTDAVHRLSWPLEHPQAYHGTAWSRTICWLDPFNLRELSLVPQTKMSQAGIPTSLCLVHLFTSLLSSFVKSQSFKWYFGHIWPSSGTINWQATVNEGHYLEHVKVCESEGFRCW